MKKLLFIIMLLAFPSFAPFPAHAQEQDSQIFVTPGSQFQNNAATISKILKKRSLAQSKKIDITNVEVSLVHYHYMEPDQFGILMKLANSVSGCFDLSPMEYEASFIDDNYMDIKVKGFRRTIVETQNVAYDCDQKSQVVSGLIVVSAKDLEERKIKQIRFSNGTTRDRYDVTILPDSIHLIPDSMVAFKAVGLAGPDNNKLIHYFKDKKIVALHVPMARSGEDIAQSVRNLAYKNALTPIFEQDGLDTSTENGGENNVFYFRDPNGKTLERIGDDGYSDFGSVQVLRPYDGPQGRTGLPVPLKVFVTRPGTTL